MSLTPRRRLRAVLLASALSMAGSGIAPQVRAAEITAEQAQQVAQQLRDWLGSLLGGLPVPPGLLRVDPAGEQVRLTIPLPPLLLMRDGDGKATDSLFDAALRPLGDTRWAIEDFRLPDHISLTPETAAVLAPSKPKPANRPGQPAAADKPGAPELEISVRSQSAKGIYDTSLQSESRLEMTAEGIRLRAGGFDDTDAKMNSSIDRVRGTFLLRPRPAGGVDAISDWKLEGQSSTSTDPLLGDIKISSRADHLRAEISGLMTAQVGSVVNTAIQWGVEAALQPPSKTVAPNAPAPKKKTPKTTATQPDDPLGEAGRAKLKTILAALKNIVAGAKLEQTIEGMQIAALGYSGAADRVVVNLGGGAPDGKLAAYLEVGLDGVTVAGLPAQYAPLVPRAVSLRPVVGNIDVAALTALAEEAAAPKADLDVLRDKLRALLTGHGVTFGFENLLIDLGTTRLTATASLTAIRPMVANAQAEIIVTGFDALMEQAQKMPEAMQAITLLALARGMARAEGNKLVWRLALSEDQKITVNGVDLRKLGGG